MAVIITFGPLVVLLGIMVAIMWPDVNVVPLFAVLLTLAVILPLVLYGSAYTMWQALDIAMRPPTPDDFEIVGDVGVDAAASLSVDDDDVRPGGP